MHRLSVGTLARAMATTMRALPPASSAPQPAAAAAPRILCISVPMRKPDGLVSGWDPDRYEIVSPGRRWPWRWLPARWRWPRWRHRRAEAPAPAVLFLSATPRGVRISLDGLLADTSTINDRRETCPNPSPAARGY